MVKPGKLDPHPLSATRLAATTLGVALALSLVVLPVLFVRDDAPDARRATAPNGQGPAQVVERAPTPAHGPPAAPDIDAVADGMTALMRAASAGRVGEVERLLAAGANPNARGAGRRTALQYAAERNRIAVAERLLDAGADIDGHDDTRLTPLIMAADRGYTQLARRLIARGADVNIAHVKGWTALIDAARTGNLALVEHLLANGADANARLPSGLTALDLARQAGHHDVAQRLARAR